MSGLVTMHAVRRYAERAMHISIHEDLSDQGALAAIADQGIDLNTIRERIRSKCAIPAQMGACAVHFDGVKAVIKDGSVVSIIFKRPPVMRPSLNEWSLPNF
ncbi:hypothetical protein [Devosia pacifica]|uniref:hypothetical protein n=1 Tax=Devosia pacifica TaxID=1335967 RepID=UPI001674BC8D|nr:hypothetical protein [Devosia pacifica]